MNALAAAGAGFLLAVLWFDLMFDVQALRSREVPVETLLPALSGTLLRLDQAGVAIDPDARSAALQAVA